MSTNDFKSGYVQVGDLNMYYEIYGTGKPLVLIHGGGSTIQTTYGNIIPMLAKSRQIIAMDLNTEKERATTKCPVCF